MIDKEYNKNEEGIGGHWGWGHMGHGHMMGCGCGYPGYMCGSKKLGKEFKLAMLDKKEKMVEAKLEFIRKMKELVKKESDSEESK